MKIAVRSFIVKPTLFPVLNAVIMMTNSATIINGTYIIKGNKLSDLHYIPDFNSGKKIFLV